MADAVFNEVDLIYADKKDARFWKEHGKQYNYLFWVRAMLTRTPEPPPLEAPGLECREEVPAVSRASSRSVLYRRMAQGFRYADAALAEALVRGDYDRALQDAVTRLGSGPLIQEGLHWIQAFRGKDPEETLDHLQTKYTRLFYDSYLPFVPPYESVYCNEQQVRGAREDAVRAFYREVGYAACGEDLLDHIAEELECLGFLAEREAGGSDTAAADAFLREHLLRWGTKLCMDVEALAGSPFYRGLAMVLRGALILEHRRLGAPAS